MRIPFPWISLRKYHHFKGTTPIKAVSWYWTPDFWGFYGRVFGKAPKTEYILTIGIVW